VGPHTLTTFEPKPGETYYLLKHLYAIRFDTTECYIDVGGIKILRVYEDFDYPYSNWYGAVEFEREGTIYAIQLYDPARFIHPVPEFLDDACWEKYIASGDVVRSVHASQNPRVDALQVAMDRGWAEGITKQSALPRKDAYADEKLQGAYERAHGRATGQSSFVGKPRPERPVVVEDPDGQLRIEWEE
jgi:hypothetical protein